MRGKTAFSGTAALAAIVALLMSAACSARTTPDPSGVSDEMVEQSVQFRQSDGLFVMPESRGATGAADYRWTATYASALEGSTVRVVDRSRLAEAPPPASVDLVGVDAYLRIREMAGAEPLDPGVLSRLAGAATLPERQPDLGAEVGALATWAEVRSRLIAAGGQVAVPPEVEDRVAALDLGGLSNHPYLVTRTAEMYSRLGMAEPAALRMMAAQVPDTELPLPASTADVLDVAAIVAAQRSPSVPDEYLDQIRAVMALGDRVEDVSRAHLITVLKDAGHQRDADRYLSELRDRVDPSTGLLQPADVDRGTVEATYLFSRLLDHRFAEVVDDTTVEKLQATAADDGAPVVDRLQAVAALQRAGAEG